jgi:Spy/CpxP family protein refolding chaperone
MKASFAATALLATGMAVTLACGAVRAQTPDTPPAPDAGRETPAQRMDHLAILLDLTDAQKTQVEAILKQEHAKMREQFEEAKASGTRPTPEEMKAKVQAIQQDTLTQLTPVLNANQLKKFQIIMEHHRPGGHRGPPPQD